MDGLVPTYSINGDGNGGGWGDAIGAFGGALIGSWFGNGFMGNGWGGYGGCGRGGFGGSGGGQAATGPAVVVMGNDGGSAELDALSNIQNSINGLGLAVVQGQGNASLATAQGFAGAVNASNQGFAGLNTAITAGNAGIQQSLCQGFGGLNTALLTSSKDNALLNCQSTGAITSAIEQCCCNTRSAIHAEGEATRALINQNYINSLQTELCDAKSENAALKSQSFIAGSQAAQSAEFRAALNQQAQQFGQLLASYRLGRIDQRDSTPTTTPTA